MRFKPQMAEGIEKAMPREMAKLIVGSPLQSMMPKVDLFDHQDLKECLKIAARCINRTTFRNKPESARRKTVADYLKRKGDDSPIGRKQAGIGN